MRFAFIWSFPFEIFPMLDKNKPFLVWYLSHDDFPGIIAQVVQHYCRAGRCIGPALFYKMLVPLIKTIYVVYGRCSIFINGWCREYYHLMQFIRSIGTCEPVSFQNYSAVQGLEFPNFA
jgi:hypothetical protein